MKKIYLFELKKILSRKIVWAGILLLLLVSAGGIREISESNVAYEQEIAREYQGVLDDEKVQRMLKDFAPSAEELEQWHGVNVAYIGKNAMQLAVHRYFANPDGSWNGKTVKDVFGDQAVQVGYYEGWFVLSRSLIRVMLVLAILAVVIVAPVFAGEYEGMAQVLLTTRYGKSKCVSAKLFAALTVIMSLVLLCIAGNLAAALAMMGTEGLDSSTLFVGVSYEAYMPFHMSCGTMLLYQIGLAASGIVMLTGAALLISAAAGTQVSALILSAALLLGPLLLQLPETNPLFKIIGLLPAYQIQFLSLMAVGRMGDTVFYAILAVPVSIAALLGGAWLARVCWGRRQVR